MKVRENDRPEIGNRTCDPRLCKSRTSRDLNPIAQLVKQATYKVEAQVFDSLTGLPFCRIFISIAYVLYRRQGCQ